MPILTCPIPDNISALNPNGFLFSIQKYPEVDYFITNAPLPSISLGEAIQTSSVHDLKIPGETMTFEDIQLDFLVDSKMANYTAIFQWIAGLGFPQGHKMFTELMASNRNRMGGSENNKMVSDCSLTILDANNLPIKKITFVDAFPTALSGLTFQSVNTDVNYLVANLTLAYSYYYMT